MRYDGAEGLALEWKEINKIYIERRRERKKELIKELIKKEKKYEKI